MAKLTLASASAFGLLPCLLLSGCVRTVQLDDPAVKPFAAMYSVDRARYGFTPLPRRGSVGIEGKSYGGDYDAMLHFDAPSRTIAFRLSGKTYEWIGEQETFYGPREYETVDGRFHESVAITFNVGDRDGAPKGWWISYDGPEEKLNHSGLTLKDVEPLLREWGYRK